MKNTRPKFKLSKTSSFPNHQADDDHQSAELIGSNDDLLTEILHRLPAKSILRFKSVSKQWLSFLTHPRFILSFGKLLKSSGLYYNELHLSFDAENPITPPFCSLDLCHDSHGMSIVQSCNGLLLFCCDKEDKWCGKYYVFNPTTNKFAVIPPIIGGPRCENLIGLMGLAYHPTECVDYKLVCILSSGYYSHGHKVYNIQIYSSKTGTWKKLNQTLTPFMHTFTYAEFKYGVYWNGAFHWAPCCPNLKYLRLDTEHIQGLPMPSPLPVKVASAHGYGYLVSTPLYFGESCGHLHLVDTADNKNSLNMNVYEMLRDHSGWFVKYQLDLNELCAAYPNMTHTEEWGARIYEFRVLDVVRGEKEEDTFMVVKVVDDIKRYNILDQSFQHLFSILDTKEFKHEVEAHRYIQKIGSF